MTPLQKGLKVLKFNIFTKLVYKSFPMKFRWDLCYLLYKCVNQYYPNVVIYPV